MIFRGRFRFRRILGMRHIFGAGNGDPGANRTLNLPVRSGMLCPLSYRAIPERRRGFEPLTFSLEGRHSTAELPPLKVPRVGVEPTSCVFQTHAVTTLATSAYKIY